LPAKPLEFPHLSHISWIFTTSSPPFNNGGAFVVGEYEGHIVAKGGLKRTACDRAEITRMRVHPDFQRQRFGSAILRHLEKRAAEFGYKTLHLDTLVVQKAAQQFYLRHGYRCVGRGHKEAFEVVFFKKKLEFA
jgi:GNAT superfamily N-acetyltransferase